MDLAKAVLYGQAVAAAYAIDPTDLANRSGQKITITPTLSVPCITSLYANDLATEMHPENSLDRVSIGLILQFPGNEIVVAIRGTEGILEWIHDAQFLPVNCPFFPPAGNTEDGFTAVYLSMRTGSDATSPTVRDFLAKNYASSQTLTICGHSLGGALVTLLALDVAANAKFNPAVYTYASPRTGDSQFVTMYNHVVPNTTRIANRVDLVPKLPLPPLYEHVLGLYDLSSVTLIPPALLIKPDIRCQHILTSYLFLLSRLAGGTVLPLNPECVPTL